MDIFHRHRIKDLKIPCGKNKRVKCPLCEVGHKPTIKHIMFDDGVMHDVIDLVEQAEKLKELKEGVSNGRKSL